MRRTLPTALAAPVVVPRTSTAPTGPPYDAGGLVATMLLSLTTEKLAATPPKVTEVVPVRFWPVIVTRVPPAGEPDEGLILVIMGA